MYKRPFELPSSTLKMYYMTFTVNGIGENFISDLNYLWPKPKPLYPITLGAWDHFNNARIPYNFHVFLVHCYRFNITHTPAFIFLINSQLYAFHVQEYLCTNSLCICSPSLLRTVITSLSSKRLFIVTLPDCVLLIQISWPPKTTR